MVTKTETCVWTEFRMYPGCGKKFVAKDGKSYFFITKKAAAFFHRKTKAVNLTWTTAWRRVNKNENEVFSSKRKRRVVRQQKAIVGMNLDEIKRRKDTKSDFRSKLRDQARKDVQDKKKKEIEARKANKKTSKGGAGPKTMGKQKGGKGLRK